ncbi:palmitoyltransferase ZDHHC14-like [Artemia franciscana]|uniref:palmitoyltransferase ZDHHC14-like n=1 Tax=Artemia franciscana TaxID=6661 RepID=UPI0032DA01BE
MAKKHRKWEKFPGRNKFYCNGRLMTAKQTGVFYITVLLIVFTSGLFFAFDCPYLTVHLSPVIPVIAGAMFIFVLSSLFRTSCMDPGIIPRAMGDEAAFIERQIEVPNSSNCQLSAPVRPPPRAKEIVVCGQVIKLKYCYTCRIFRPPRASHCSICDNCVDRFDHHCPWVGNCVGKRNYRFFYSFIVSLAVYCIYIFSCSVAHLMLITIGESKDLIDAIRDSPTTLTVAVICFFSVWSVLCLACYHTCLIMSSQTTNEDVSSYFSHILSFKR